MFVCITWPIECKQAFFMWTVPKDDIFVEIGAYVALPGTAHIFNPPQRQIIAIINDVAYIIMSHNAQWTRIGSVLWFIYLRNLPNFFLAKPPLKFNAGLTKIRVKSFSRTSLWYVYWVATWSWRSSRHGLRKRSSSLWHSSENIQAVSMNIRDGLWSNSHLSSQHVAKDTKAVNITFKNATLSFAAILSVLHASVLQHDVHFMYVRAYP